MRNRVRRIHFVGIGGAGMSGIAEVLHNLKFIVTGSDAQEGATTRRLRDLGIPVAIGHDGTQVAGTDVVVISSAVSSTNPEVVAARAAKIPVIPRAEMLGELMRFQQGVAVAGTHGKTTTTSLITSVLAQGGLDPTFVIGGRLNSAGSNARLGFGEYLVAEADESDASFLHLQPVIAVVTNIDADHMDTYQGDFEKLKQAFVAFLHNLPFYGLAVLCVDDPAVRAILPEVHKPVLTYGLSPDAQVRATGIAQDGMRMRFDVALGADAEWLRVELNQPGRHNVLNALAAVAVANELGVKREAIREGLAAFGGIGRRFQVNGYAPIGGGDVMFVDDYGHHPREIAATVAAAREGWPGRRLITVFQPHRYTRTRDLFQEFTTAFNDADVLFLTSIYAAGEDALPGVTAQALSEAVASHGHRDVTFVEKRADLASAMLPRLKEGDLVVTLGAGDITQVGPDLLIALQR